jgi:hypothetical protein
MGLRARRVFVRRGPRCLSGAAVAGAAKVTVPPMVVRRFLTWHPSRSLCTTSPDLLRAGGVETFESCEGGEGHAYPEPTVAFLGGAYAGWLAMSICLANGLPVASLRRVWIVEELNDVTGPRWEVVFRRRLA